MAFPLIAGGFIMWLVDAVLGTRGRTRDVEELSLWQAIWIGLCQTLAALFPGTSRSMSTIAAGEIAGLSRATALEFSFLVSMPTIVVATLYELYKSIRYPESDALGALHLDVHEMIVLAIGFAMSFLVAWGVVAWFLSWVRRRGFTAFAIYRILLGIGVLLWMRK